jgi:hypothetical protein
MPSLICCGHAVPLTAAWDKADREDPVYEAEWAEEGTCPHCEIEYTLIAQGRVEDPPDEIDEVDERKEDAA